MTNFKDGDMVELKSGGPKMTIMEIDDQGGLTCQWFSGSELTNAYFDKNSVIKVEQTDE
jgi:uncharacterized protein YodC (DUF2158 family)